MTQLWLKMPPVYFSNLSVTWMPHESGPSLYKWALILSALWRKFPAASRSAPPWTCPYSETEYFV